MQIEDIKDKVTIYKEYESLEKFKNFLDSLPEENKDDYYPIVSVESKDSNVPFAAAIITSSIDFEEVFYINYMDIIDNEYLQDMGLEDEIDPVNTIEKCIECLMETMLDNFNLYYEEE